MNKQVMVVTGKNCHGCKVQKQWLNEAKISFKELDVEKNIDFVARLGLMGLPITVVMAGDKIIHAYAGTVKAEEVKEMLGE